MQQRDIVETRIFSKVRIVLKSCGRSFKNMSPFKINVTNNKPPSKLRLCPELNNAHLRVFFECYAKSTSPQISFYFHTTTMPNQYHIGFHHLKRWKRENVRYFYNTLIYTHPPIFATGINQPSVTGLAFVVSNANIHAQKSLLPTDSSIPNKLPTSNQISPPILDESLSSRHNFKQDIPNHNIDKQNLSLSIFNTNNWVIRQILLDDPFGRRPR